MKNNYADRRLCVDFSCQIAKRLECGLNPRIKIHAMYVHIAMSTAGGPIRCAHKDTRTHCTLLFIYILWNKIECRLNVTISNARVTDTADTLTYPIPIYCVGIHSVHAIYWIYFVHTYLSYVYSLSFGNTFSEAYVVYLICKINVYPQTVYQEKCYPFKV